MGNVHRNLVDADNQTKPHGLPHFEPPVEVMERYTTALEKCSKSHCHVREYVELRTELFTHAVMYGRVIFPESQKFVRNVRNAMEYLTLIENAEQFSAQMRSRSADCSIYEKRAEDLEHQHGFVAGKLCALATKLEEEKLDLDEREHKLEEGAGEEERKSHVLRGVGIASCATIALIPMGVAAFREGKKHKEKAHNQHAEAVELRDAVENIKLLEECCSQMREMVHSLAKILVIIGTQINFVGGLIENANAIQIEDEAVYSYLKWIREAASFLVGKLDPFIEGRVDYYATIEAIGSKHQLPESVVSDWRVNLNNYMTEWNE